MIISVERKIRDLCNDKIKDFKIKDVKVDSNTYVIGNDTDNENDVTYVFVDNNIIVTSKFSNDIYEFKETPTLSFLEGIKVLDFAKMDKKFFSDNRMIIWKDLAIKSIDEFIVDWCNVNSLDELYNDDKILYEKLIKAVKTYDDAFDFWKYGLVGITGAIDWFTTQHANIIFNSGFGITEQAMIHWMGLEIILNSKKQSLLQK